MASTQWQDLLYQSQDLLQQDYHDFPRVERNLQQVQQLSEKLRNSTNGFRTRDNEASATRVLAQQGYDASRLQQEAASVAVVIQPTIQDVYPTETSSVEDYLKQLEESTILATIQEAQQGTVEAFENLMDECMARDWTASKRQLFGLIAPHTGHVRMSAGGGAGPLIGRGPGIGGAGLGSSSQLVLPPREKAYVEVVKQYHETRTKGQPFDLVRNLLDACKANEEKAHETPMSTCWQAVYEMLAEVRGRNISGAKLGEGLVVGARKHLERVHVTHMRSTIARHKHAAERGADPDLLREVQAFVQLKFTLKGPLDFQTPGGLDTSWIQVYYCLRNGYLAEARRAAEKAGDASSTSRLGGPDLSLRSLLDEWLRNGGRLSERNAMLVSRECERVMKDKVAMKAQIKTPFQVLVLCLLAGDNRSAEALSGQLQTLQLQPVLSTIEDYMWSKLTIVSSQLKEKVVWSPLQAAAPSSATAAGPSSSGTLASYGSIGTSLMQAPIYTITDLQADLNRWSPTYYSRNNREPLLYALVLLLSLQFHNALKLLWKEESTRLYRADAVHLALVLQLEGALSASTGATTSTLDIGNMVQSYGSKFAVHDSRIALQYLMLAANIKGGSLTIKGQIIRDLIIASKDYGTLLGGGGLLNSYITDPEERRRLYEAVAYECQVAAQPDEAVELYLAADQPRQALVVLNQQISSLIPEAVSQNQVASERMRQLQRKAQSAVERMPSADDAEVQAFRMLCMLRELLWAVRNDQLQQAVHSLSQLPFLPLEKGRVDICVRHASMLHPAVADRLHDAILAALDVLQMQRKQGADAHRLRSLRAQLEALQEYVQSTAHRLGGASLYLKIADVGRTLT